MTFSEYIQQISTYPAEFIDAQAKDVLKNLLIADVDGSVRLKDLGYIMATRCDPARTSPRVHTVVATDSVRCADIGG
ncbi:hypothetical protein UFOVP820_3 [uncultured Caudovirales phage]|uniref:Uncharacterized protein n=1 Tax=uncultured Caudovirales phage TaxID=2100421 RepID=A0A6J5P7I1_9CAUD|nr:hypothetical protein UFOVP820_3 [uncultured Caudovirales phage]